MCAPRPRCQVAGKGAIRFTAYEQFGPSGYTIASKASSLRNQMLLALKCHPFERGKRDVVGPGTESKACESHLKTLRFKMLLNMSPAPKASVDFLAGIGAGFAEALQRQKAGKLCRCDPKTGDMDVFQDCLKTVLPCSPFAHRESVQNSTRLRCDAMI